MINDVFEWLSLLLRWLHVITAIAWIGASFYFVWLDNSLETPPGWKQKKGIKGDLWAFHGGGIYEVAKYQMAPETMPNQLHWFKWEAYSTWITGTLLLCAVYYWQADLYLTSAWLPNGSIAVVASVAFILAGLVFYETLFRYLADKQKALVFALVAYIACSCWLATQLFSGRAAFLHVGAMLATIMAGNVFLGIMPAQRGFIKAIEAQQTPDAGPMLLAKSRSVHNNYFTLPVIFCMISNHYAFLYTHPYNWVVLLAILGISAYARHFFNLRHRGIIKPAILIQSVLAVVVLAIVMSYLKSTSSLTTANYAKESHAKENHAKNVAASTGEATGEKAQALFPLVLKHCTTCHSVTPSQLGFSAPPAGMMLDSMEQVAFAKAKMLEAIASNYMPLGNITGMSDEERTQLILLLQNLPE